MQPAAWPEPDPQITAAIASMYHGRKTPRPLAVQIRDRLGEWLHDEEFASAFGDRGRPGWSPSRLALVTVLQRAEKLTDRMAADAVRMRLDWKYLMGLPLDDPGFDDSVLSEFRGKVAGAELEQAVLDALLEQLAADGLVAEGGKQRTDSTHVVAAVAALNRLELAGEAVRAALEALAAPERAVLLGAAHPHGPSSRGSGAHDGARRDRDGIPVRLRVSQHAAPLHRAVAAGSSRAWRQHVPGRDADGATGVTRAGIVSGAAACAAREELRLPAPPRR